MLNKLFARVDRYLDEHLQPESPVVEWLEPERLGERLDLEIPEHGVGEDELLRLIDDYLKYSVRTGHPQFLNQLYQGFNPAGFAGEVVTAATNTSMYTYEVAPVATLIENHLISKMCGIAGFEDGDGILVPGGSLANLTAVLAARNRANPISRHTGAPADMVLFVSDQAHYSFEKAANIAGIGIDNVVKVESDASGRLVPGELDAAARRAIEDGRQPFMVVATAGTTVLGAFDPIEEMAGIAERYGCWLHVDGALGGSALLSSRHRSLLRGVDRADSLAWNPHKTMGVPLICSALLVREKGVLEATMSCDHSDYLFHDDESPDLGRKSIQCGRRVDALKLWLSWKYYGDAGYETRVTRLFDLAGYAKRRIIELPGLELMAPVASFNVCFRFAPEGARDEELDSLNRNIRESLLRSGLAAVNYATVRGRTSIRIAVLNPDLEESDIDRFLANVLETAEAVSV